MRIRSFLSRVCTSRRFLVIGLSNCSTGLITNTLLLSEMVQPAYELSHIVSF
jgi:hypothetical protein